MATLAFAVLTVGAGRLSPAAERLLRLQTGSDLRGHVRDASDASPAAPQLEPPTMYCIGAGFARWLAPSCATGSGPRIALGHDPRTHGPALLEAFAAGCAGVPGARVTAAGLATTPAMAEACGEAGGGGHDGAAMITASHLPSHWNGVKFFTPSGGVAEADVAAILRLAAGWLGAVPSPPPAAPDTNIDRRPRYLAEGYAALLRERCLGNESLAGLRVVVNAGHGSGGFLATDVLAPLGADVSGSIHLTPDGRFPAHPPNPEAAAAVAATIRAVATARADIGIILDADGDRCGLVLGARDGRPPLPVTRNRLIALLSRIVLQRYPGSVVVTDSVTSEGLARFLAAHGGVHLRAKKGYRSVIDAARRADANPALPPCHLAVETSGHAAVKENRWLDDGAYLALLVVRQAARQGGVAGLLALLEGLQEPAESVESRLAVRPPATAAAVCDRLAAALRQAAGRSVPHWSVDTVQPEGLRVRVDEGDGRSGWAMVRASLHEPIVTIVAESDRPGGVAAIHRDLLDHVFPLAHTADDLDLTPLLPTA